jgi:hypothetical protein
MKYRTALVSLEDSGSNRQPRNQVKRKSGTRRMLGALHVRGRHDSFPSVPARRSMVRGSIVQSRQPRQSVSALHAPCGLRSERRAPSSDAEENMRFGGPSQSVKVCSYSFSLSCPPFSRARFRKRGSPTYWRALSIFREHPGPPGGAVSRSSALPRALARAK